jgi:hypothetical protein
MNLIRGSKPSGYSVSCGEEGQIQNLLKICTESRGVMVSINPTLGRAPVQMSVRKPAILPSSPGKRMDSLNRP